MTTQTTHANTAAYDVIALGKIHPSPTNPRRHFPEAKMAEMAESVKAYGVIQPILVRPWPEGRPFNTEEAPEFELVAGERRWRASTRAEVDSIPAIVRALTDSEVIEIQVIENLQREDVTAIEEAEGFQIIMDHNGMSADELAAKMGKSRGYIYGRLKLLNLCEKGREALREGTLSASIALLVARVPSTLQEEALQSVLEPMYGNGPLSHRAASDRLQRDYMLNLERAKFDPKAEALVFEAGSCEACPKRTGNNPEIFGDTGSNQLCTDPSCYKAKEAAHLELLVATATESGATVIPADQTKLRYEWSQITPNNPPAGYQVATTELKAKLPEAPVVQIVDEQAGALVECIANADIPKDMRAGASTQSPEQAKAALAMKQEGKVRQELLASILETLRADLQTEEAPQLTEFFMRLIARQFFARVYNTDQGKIGRRFVEGTNDTERAAKMPEFIEHASRAQLIELMVSCAIFGMAEEPHWHGNMETPAPLLATAKVLMVDAEQIRARVVAEAEKKTAPTPRKAARAGEGRKSEKASVAKSAGDAAPSIKVGDRVRIKAGACFESGAPIGGGDEIGTTREAVSDGYSVVFESGAVRTYVPTYALEQVKDDTPAAKPAARASAKATPKTKPAAKTAARAGAKKPAKSKSQAARGAASKAKGSSRARPAGGKEKAEEAPVERCPNTLEMDLEGVR